MTFADSLAQGAKAEKRALAAFTDSGWCCIPHGEARMGQVQMRLLSPSGEKLSTDFVCFRGNDYIFAEIKSKRPLDRGGFGLDLAQWRTLLEHEDSLTGRTLVIIENRATDKLVAARVTDLQAAPSELSWNGLYIFFSEDCFRPLAEFLEGENARNQY